MNLFRRMGIWLCGTLFAVGISYLLFYSVLSTTVLDSHTVKGWLRSSNAYTQFANGVIAPTIKSSYASQTQAGSLITPDMIQTASEASVTPSFVKNTAETQLDAFYGWIDGKTKAAPSFSIPLQNAQDSFFASLKGQILAKLSTLPSCQTGQQGVDISGQVSCLPSGISAQDLADQLTNDLKDNSSLFTKPVSGSDFSDGQTNTTTSPANTAPQATKSAANSALPAYIQSMRLLYPIAWIAVALLAVALFFLASSRQQGLINIGWHIFSPGILFAVAGLAAVILGPRLDVSQIISGSQSGLVSLLQSLLKTIITSIGARSLIVGGVAIVVSLLFIGGGYLWKRQSVTVTTPPVEPPIEPPLALPPAPSQPPVAPPPRPRPPLIQ